MTPEVADMIVARRSAEQRGLYSPLGRLLWMQTEHGTIQFPAVDGVGTGPDLGVISREGDGPTPEAGAFLVLGEWTGLPALRSNTQEFCTKCLHACDVCDGSGRKLCELCGGSGVILGNWLPCPGPGCTKETEKFSPECTTCGGSGQTREKLECTMCVGSYKMTCPRCRGTGKFATGRVDGITDWAAKNCKHCDGTGFQGEWKAQPLEKFTNASIRSPKSLKTGKRVSSAEFLALGPILCFGVRDFQTLRGTIYDSIPDSHNDMLMLLVPASSKQRPQKAYLVGGVLRMRQETRTA